MTNTPLFTGIVYTMILFVLIIGMVGCGSTIVKIDGNVVKTLSDDITLELVDEGVVTYYSVYVHGDTPSPVVVLSNGNGYRTPYFIRNGVGLIPDTIAESMGFISGGGFVESLTIGSKYYIYWLHHGGKRNMIVSDTELDLQSVIKLKSIL